MMTIEAGRSGDGTPLDQLSREELVALVKAYDAVARRRASQITELMKSRLQTQPRTEAEAIANRRIVKFTLRAVSPFEKTYRKIKPQLRSIKTRMRIAKGVDR
ncbi:hypothetical protein [Microcella sp.]|uniref:hypothetical protein n=1 Tax=Microcella sp. TaxID=1913979 RepID=UPI003918A6FA